MHVTVLAARTSLRAGRLPFSREECIRASVKACVQMGGNGPDCASSAARDCDRSICGNCKTFCSVPGSDCYEDCRKFCGWT
jgi:hypothetical protein